MWIEWVTTLALSTKAFCATLFYSCTVPHTGLICQMISNTGLGECLPGQHLSSYQISFPSIISQILLYLAISPSCLQLFTNDWSSNFPLAEKERKTAKFFLPSSIISSSSCSGGRLKLSYKRCSISLLFQRKSDLLWYEPGYSLICNPMQCILVLNVSFFSLLQLMFIFLILTLDCKLLQHGFIELF